MSQICVGCFNPEASHNQHCLMWLRVESLKAENERLKQRVEELEQEIKDWDIRLLRSRLDLVAADASKQTAERIAAYLKTMQNGSYYECAIRREFIKP